MTIWFFLFLLLLGAAALVVILLSSRLHFEVKISRIVNNDRISMDMSTLFGLVKYRYHIPMIDLLNWTEGIFIKKISSMKAVTNADNKAEFQVTRELVLAYYEKIRLLLNNVVDLNGWLKDTLVHVECTLLQWQTRIGVGDAPETAITTGIVWGVKSSLLSYALKQIKLKTKPYVQVFPQYNQRHFSTELTWKTQIRLFYIALAGIKLLPRIWKAKGSWKSWQHILSKPRLKSSS